MAQVRLHEEDIRDKKDRIVFLKAQREMVRSVSDIKAHPSWVGMKTILGSMVKRQQGVIDAALSTRGANLDDLLDAKKAYGIRDAAEYMISLVEKNDDGVKDIDDKIANLQDIVEKAESGELIDRR